MNKDRKAVIITERKDHIDTLYQFLKQSYEAITLSGDDTENSRNTKWKLLKDGNYQVLITTGQFFGEGTDLQNASCLFLVYPFSFKGKLIQYIGRVQRAEIAPVIYDYHDYKIDYLNKLFLKRNTYYRKLDRQATLFDEPEEIDKSVQQKNILIEKTIKIPVASLEFRFGAVAFNYKIQDAETILELEIEHENIRPEFEVLKPYFIKFLQSKNIEVELYIEFDNGKLIAQHAHSESLDKINEEVIDSMKFRFLE